jgi:hypothetical protein
MDGPPATPPPSTTRPVQTEAPPEPNKKRRGLFRK